MPFVCLSLALSQCPDFSSLLCSSPALELSRSPLFTLRHVTSPHELRCCCELPAVYWPVCVVVSSCRSARSVSRIVLLLRRVIELRTFIARWWPYVCMRVFSFALVLCYVVSVRTSHARCVVTKTRVCPRHRFSLPFRLPLWTLVVLRSHKPVRCGSTQFATSFVC